MSLRSEPPTFMPPPQPDHSGNRKRQDHDAERTSRQKNFSFRSSLIPFPEDPSTEKLSMGASQLARRKFFEWLVKSSETLPASEGHRGSIPGLVPIRNASVLFGSASRAAIVAAIPSAGTCTRGNRRGFDGCFEFAAHGISANALTLHRSWTLPHGVRQNSRFALQNQEN